MTTILGWRIFKIRYLRFIDALRESYRDFIGQHYAIYAAGLSFFTLISFVPLLVVTTTILSFFPFHAPEVAKILAVLIPNINFDIAKFINHTFLILAEKRQWFAIFGFALTYYLGSRLFDEFHRVLWKVFNKDQDYTVPWHRQLIYIPLFIVCLFVLYIGNFIVAELLRSMVLLHFIEKVIPIGSIKTYLNVADWVTWFTFFVFVSAIYHYLVPRKNRKLHYSISISVLVSLTLSITKVWFGKVVIVLAQVNPIYAAFGGLFAFFSWVYLFYSIILIGARMFFYLEDRGGLK